MKLRLPLSLRNAIVGGLMLAGASPLLSTAWAESISLPTEVTWSENDAPGYTGNEGDSYTATNSTWAIQSGTYQVALPSTNASYTPAVNLESSALSNTGTLNVSNAEALYSNALTAGGTFSISNHTGGTLAVSAITSEANMARAEGIYVYGNGQILNEAGGTFIVEMLSDVGSPQTGSSSETQALYLSGSSSKNIVVRNAGQMRLESSSFHYERSAACAFQTSGLADHGASSNDACQLINESGGEVSVSSTVTADEADAGGIAMLEGAKLVNSANANIETSVFASGTTASATGVCFRQANVLNEAGGTMKVSASAIGATASATGISLDELVTFVNKGDIIVDIAVTGDQASECGLRLGGMETYLLNSGSLKVNTVTNNATMHLLDDSITSSYATGSTLIIGGTGEIRLGGTLGEDNTVSSNASGSTMRIDSALALTGVTINFVDNVTLKMAGDLVIGQDCTMSWNGNSLTVDNGTSAHVVTIGSDFEGEWDGAISTKASDTGFGYTLVQHEASQHLKISHGTLHGSALTAENVTLSCSVDEDVIVSDSTITIEGGKGSLSNVSIEGNSQIIGSGEDVVLTMSNVKVVLNELRCTVGPEMALMALEDEPAPYTSTLTLTTDMLKGLSLSGDLTLDFSGLGDEITTSDSLLFAFDESVDITGLTSVQGTFDGLTYSTGTLSDGVILFSFSEGSESIPEPTTATLTLLALSGILVRRRRR